MKKILFVAILAMLTIGCKQQASTYTIQGAVQDTTGINGKTAYLVNLADEQNIDSCVVKDGRFTLKGKADSTQIAMVVVDYFFAYIIPEEGEINLKLTDFGGYYAISGTPLNDKLQAFNSEMNVVNNDRQAQIDALYADSTLSAAEQEIKAEALSNKYEEVSQVIFSNYLNANKNNKMGIFVLSIMPLYQMPMAKIDSLFNLVPAAKNVKSLQHTRDIRFKQETVVAGTQFIDFSGVDANGKATKLSDYAGKGNYVLVDFWASWCGPCRKSMPVLKEIYEKYKDKGLVVLGINVDDEKKSFDITMSEIGITWPQICQFDGNKSATTAYGIDSIPTLILFGPDGKMIARNISTDEVKAMLEKTYDL